MTIPEGEPLTTTTKLTEDDRLVPLTSNCMQSPGIPWHRPRPLSIHPLAWALPLQALLLLSNLDLLEPWSDEGFTLSIVPKPLSQVLSGVAGNIHPPLYFVLLHYWTQLPCPLSPT